MNIKDNLINVMRNKKMSEDVKSLPSTSINR